MRTRGIRIGAIVAGASFASALAGCVDLSRATAALSPAQLNVESPVAPAVQAAQTQVVGFPGFRDVPAKLATADQRSPLEMRRTINGLDRSGSELSAWVSDNPALAATPTDAFNASALGALKFDAGDAPPADQAARSEAYAARLRAQSTPPPPPK